jgi:integrase
MRTLRAIYTHARKTHRALPVDNPVDAVDWNKEERRNTAMGASDLAPWFAQLAKLDNPIRREFHLLVLLTGSRPTAMKSVRPEDFDCKRRVLHIAKPKGGSKRAFDIPLSRQIIRAIIRVMRHGRKMHPNAAGAWLFPAESKSGHIEEHKEDRADLSKWGNDLRQSYRTLATIAGVSEVDAKLLMNHSIPGVNSGYITRHKLLEDHLRHQQQAISDVMLLHFGS